MLKVYKMNDYDWVISPLSIEETNNWYIKEMGYDMEEQTLDMVEECSLDDGYYSEAELSDVIAELEHAEENKIIKVLKGHGYWIWESFKDAIDRIEKRGIEEPEIICSTEC